MTKEKKLLTAVAAGAVVLLGLVFHFTDFSAPELTLVDSFEKDCGSEISVYDLVEQVSDKSDVELTLSTDDGTVQAGEKCVIFEQAGRFSVEVTARDAHGNVSQQETTVVSLDTVAPNLSAEVIAIYEGETPDYTAAVTAQDNADGDLSQQVRVDDSLLNPDKSGTYTVIYRVSDRSGNEALFNGQVVVLPAPAQGITLSKTEVQLGGNEYIQLEAVIEPEDWEGTVEWSSSDEAVATVSDGLVYWKGKGECTITAQADQQTAKCSVVCGSVQPTTVTLSRHTLELDEGQSEKLTASTLPSNWNGAVTWVSSNPGVATVEDGTVTWVGNGSCYVSAYANDTLYDSCLVTCTGGFSLGDWLGGLFGGTDDAEEEDAHHTSNQKKQKQSGEDT